MGLSLQPVVSDVISKEIVSELRWIVGQPAGITKLLLVGSKALYGSSVRVKEKHRRKDWRVVVVLFFFNSGSQGRLWLRTY